jgi:uncharacterized protein YrrD
MDDETAIAWMALEKGTPVYAADEAELGKVTEIVADRQKDIFSGVAISAGLLDGDKFLPADRIERITTKRVVTNVTQEEAGSLEPYEG